MDVKQKSTEVYNHTLFFLQDVLDSKNSAIRDLQYELARVCKVKTLLCFCAGTCAHVYVHVYMCVCVCWHVCACIILYVCIIIIILLLCYNIQEMMSTLTLLNCIGPQ